MVSPLILKAASPPDSNLFRKGNIIWHTAKKVIDHYENPRNVGSMDKKDNSVGTGMVGAPACGDVMQLQIKVNDSGIIEDAKFKLMVVALRLHQVL